MRTLIAARIRKLGAASEWRCRDRTKGRNPGWLKIWSTEPNVWGALNVSWDAHTRTLTCRVVNKQLGSPHQIIGRFVDFLLRNDDGRIRLISIFQV